MIRSTVISWSLTGLALLCLLPPCVRDGAATTAAEVREFVRAVYIEGVPYEQASQLAPDVALPVLKELLNQPEEEAFWANVVITIGMIGDERGVKLLKDFVVRQEARSRLSRAQTAAKTSAVMALGYIVNKTGSREALDFLTTGVDPQAWHRRELAWSGEYLPTDQERDEQLAMMAVLGLGVSGNAEAAAVLRSLEGRPERSEMHALAKEALDANIAISRQGIRSYYRNIKARRPPEESAVDREPNAEQEVARTPGPGPGEVLRQPQPGDVLKEPQVGDVVSPPKTGEVLRPLAPGEVVEVPE